MGNESDGGGRSKNDTDGGGAKLDRDIFSNDFSREEKFPMFCRGFNNFVCLEQMTSLPGIIEEGKGGKGEGGGGGGEEYKEEGEMEENEN